MSTETAEVASSTASSTPEEPTPISRIDMWRSNISRCDIVKKDMVPDWSLNVDYRRGKPFQEDSDLDRIRVPMDWSATKAKQAQLFSQVPEIRLAARLDAARPITGMWAGKVNAQVDKSRVGVSMDEQMPDCINAAGFGACIISYDTLTEMRDVMKVTPEMAAQLKATGQDIPTESTQVVLDKRFCVTRVSPGDFLWEVSFTGSDFDDSPWLGHKGRKTWADAKACWSKLTEADKRKVLGEDDRDFRETLVDEGSGRRSRKTDVVNYTEVFYWRYLFHADETCYDAIHHLVFVHGKDEPVIDEPWKGQKRTADGKVIGPYKLPIRVLTLTYISDESIPPSDTAMGRPQVDELNRSRGQMIRNREASVPLRWMNVNLVDTNVQTAMMRGTWQGIIPVNGSGDRAFGEVARAAYPPEDGTFDNIAKQDLRETWQVQDAVEVGPAIRSAAEANNRQANFQTRIGYERARCARHFVGIVEVLAGLMVVCDDFTDQERQHLQQAQIDPAQLCDAFTFKVRADSTLLLDASQRIQMLMSYLNMTAKSGYVDIAPIIEEITELHGLDPAKVLKQPAQQGPEPVNISMTLKGSEDLTDPLVVAMLIQNKQMPSADVINQAKLLLASLQMQPTPPAPPMGGPEGAPGAPPAPGAAPGGPPQAPGGRIVAPPDQGRGPQAPYTAHPDYNTVNRVEKRAEDGK